MTMDECAEMLTCNLAGTLHNEWLQQFGNKMICLYEATVDDLIWAFIQIANYISWLRGGYTSKGHDYAPLKLKVVAMCGDPKLLADAMKSYPGLKDLNTKDCALEGSELFGSINKSVICHQVWIVTHTNPIKWTTLVLALILRLEGHA